MPIVAGLQAAQTDCICALGHSHAGICPKGRMEKRHLVTMVTSPSPPKVGERRGREQLAAGFLFKKEVDAVAFLWRCLVLSFL